MERSGREELSPDPVNTQTSYDILDVEEFEVDDDEEGTELDIHSCTNVSAVR